MLNELLTTVFVCSICQGEPASLRGGPGAGGAGDGGSAPAAQPPPASAPHLRRHRPVRARLFVSVTITKRKARLKERFKSAELNLQQPFRSKPVQGFFSTAGVARVSVQQNLYPEVPESLKKKIYMATRS